MAFVLSTALSKKKSLQKALTNWRAFWEVHFLLQLALVSLCACSLFYQDRLLTTLLFITLGCSLLANRFILWRIFLIAILFSTLLFLHPYSMISFPSEEIEGIFTPTKIASDQKKGYLRLEGRIEITHENKLYLAPLWVSLPQKKALYSQYHVSGTIKNLKPLRLQNSSIKTYPIEKTPSLASLRYKLHAKIHDWILSRTSPFEREGELLSALFIGTKPDDITRRSFAKNGLQHVLAISGLHFGLIAAIFSIILTFLSMGKLKKLILFTLLTLYFVLLSPSPSILRAYIASSSYILSSCLNRKLLPLNALGLGVFLGCMIDPLSEETLSFELSFLATFAILLLFKPISMILNPQTKKNHSSLHRFRRSFHRGMMNNLSLTLAASSMTIPLLLCTFQQFPLLSIYWNLFIPYLIGLTMTLFAFSALLFPLFSMISGYGIQFCCYSLKQILDLLEEPRSQGDLILSLPPSLMISLIFLFGYLGIIAFKQNDLKNGINS